MRAWLQAARPAAAVNIQLPLAFGQALAYTAHAAFSPAIGLWLVLYGLCMQLYIVFLNDWADQRADALNDTPTAFSGGSRVLVEQSLRPEALQRAGSAAGWAVVALGLLFAFLLQRPLAPVLFIGGLFLLWAYSLPPLRLNYRGGGELLQALGVGCILPLAGFYGQTGHLPTFSASGDPLSLIALISAYIYLQVAAAIAFTLPDAAADRRAGKRTLAALLGVKKAAAIAVVLGLFTHLFSYTSYMPKVLVYLPAFPLALALFFVPRSDHASRYALWLAALLIAPSVLFALAALHAATQIEL